MKKELPSMDVMIAELKRMRKEEDEKYGLPKVCQNCNAKIGRYSKQEYCTPCELELKDEAHGIKPVEDKPVQPVFSQEEIINNLIINVRKDVPVLHFIYRTYKRLTDSYYNRSLHEANKTALLIQEYKSNQYGSAILLEFNTRATQQLEINKAILTLTKDNRYVELVIATRFLDDITKATEFEILQAFKEGLK